MTRRRDLALALPLLVAAALPLAAQPIRVSVASNGTQAEATYFARVSLSADGRFVAFVSPADHLTNQPAGACEPACDDVFVHDRITGVTTLISRPLLDPAGANGSRDPAISADGRFVAFTSAQSNLIAHDDNLADDVYIADRFTGSISRLSVASNGSESDGSSGRPAISADGRFVSFQSVATNLVPGDTNNAWDVFVHDRATGVTTRVNVAADGTQANETLLLDDSSAISADGRFIAFSSRATNLVPGDNNEFCTESTGYGPAPTANCRDVFVKDRLTGAIDLVSRSSHGELGNRYSYAPEMSADGRFVAFASNAFNLVADDTNDFPDVFVRDRQTGTTTRVSVAPNGNQARESRPVSAPMADTSPSYPPATSTFPFKTSSSMTGSSIGQHA